MSAGAWHDGVVSWQEALQGICDGVAIVDTQGVQQFVNRAFCEMTGYEPHELLGQSPPFAYWPPEELDNIRTIFSRALQGETRLLELTLSRKNGERFPALLHPGQITHAEHTVGYIATVIDISERRRLEQAVERSEQHWRSIAENPFEFVVVIDRSYRFTFVNHPYPGIRMEDLLGKLGPLDFLAPDQRDTVRQVLESVFETGQPAAYEHHAPSLGRAYSTIVGPIREVRDGKPYVTALSLLGRDITEQRLAEQAVRQSQRMDSLGRLASGIAHDFNNLLVPILGNARLLETQVAADDSMRAHVADIITAGERARELVSRILMVGREGSGEREPVRLQALAQEICRFLRASLPDNITIETQFDDNCPPVMGSPGELHQVINNLCSNAIAALGLTGGTVRLSVAAVRTAADLPPVAARIVIEDTGPGIPPDLHSRVFEPFFTTAPVGKGTGLGLSIVHAIVTRHGGHIRLVSQPGAGARFEIEFPATQESAPQSAPVAPDTAPVARSSRRLVCVDDDDMVLRWYRVVLEAAGHDVVAFDNPLRAIEYCQSHAHQIDCVVSDELMPEIKGSQLAAQLATSTPLLPVVLISGITVESESVGAAESVNVRHRLSKPINRQRLLDVIAHVTANR